MEGGNNLELEANDQDNTRSGDLTNVVVVKVDQGVLICFEDWMGIVGGECCRNGLNTV